MTALTSGYVPLVELQQDDFVVADMDSDQFGRQ
jgi:hypothetical protein